MTGFSESLTTAASYRQAGNLPAAENLCREMLAADPRRAPAHYLLGCVLKDQRRFADALLSFQQAVTHEPKLAEAWFEAGTIYHGAARARPDAHARHRDAVAAEQAYRAAITARPDYVAAWSNLGAVYRSLANPHDAITCYQRVIAIRPDFVAAHNNLAVALVTLGRMDEALASYDEALRWNPEDAETHKNRGLACLALGRFAEGWPEYEWRWKCPDFYTPHAMPQWDGRPLENRTLLVHAEQGFGDAIQFVRYVRMVAARGDRVVLEAKSPLVALFKQSGIPCVVAQGDALPPCDVRIPLMSMPVAFQTTFETIPHDVPYLSAEPNLIEAWRAKLPGAGKFRIAIAWQCSVNNAGDQFRSIPLANFKRVANMQDVQLLSVQKDVGLEQIAQLAADWPLVDLSEQLSDFHHTAAVFANVDLIITCDTAVAHLGGALGVPTWVALPKAADWRWFLDREDSPWYPTVRLFRQSTLGDWSDVFAHIASALSARLADRSAPGTIRQIAVVSERHVRTAVVGYTRLRGPLVHFANPSWHSSPRSPKRTSPSHAPMTAFLETLTAADSHRQAGNLPAAEQLCRQMLAADPRRAAAHYLLGCVLKDQRRFADALVSFHQAVTHEPKLAEAWFEAGTIYHGAARARPDAPSRRRDATAAEQAYRAAVAARPDYVEAWSNLGAVYRSLADPLEAIACYQRVIAIRPDFTAAHNNLAVALVALGRIDEAIASYDEGLRWNPDDAESHKNRALACLSIGRFAEGWTEYEWRWKRPDFYTPHTMPQWDGSPLENRTLLVHAEQGFGDTMQFVRYVPLVAASGAAVVLEAQPSLISLFKQSGIQNVVAPGQPLPRCDLRIPLMSMPVAFRTTVETIPHDVPYLSADPNLIEAWRAKLPGAGKFRIAIAWQCSVNHAGDQFRSIPLANFAPVARTPGVQLISVQKDIGLEQIAEVASDWPLVDVSAQLHDFHQTAAVLNNVDLVITCDAAVAHLAGAIGLPTWVALARAADWRWFLDRDDSPWYPTMRLFRQSALGQWSDVFQRIAAALGPLVNAQSERDST